MAKIEEIFDIPEEAQIRFEAAPSFERYKKLIGGSSKAIFLFAVGIIFSLGFLSVFNGTFLNGAFLKEVKNIKIISNNSLIFKIMLVAASSIPLDISILGIVISSSILIITKKKYNSLDLTAKILIGSEENPLSDDEISSEIDRYLTAEDVKKFPLEYIDNLVLVVYLKPREHLTSENIGRFINDNEIKKLIIVGGYGISRFTDKKEELENVLIYKDETNGFYSRNMTISGEDREHLLYREEGIKERIRLGEEIKILNPIKALTVEDAIESKIPKPFSKAVYYVPATRDTDGTIL